MRFIAFLVAGAFLATTADAQERWRRLPAGASAYQVDLHSLHLDQGVLRARVQTGDLGNIVLVREVEVRCKAGQARTVARSSYDGDTGRPIPDRADDRQGEAVWIGYPSGSEGHALLSGLCQVARERNVPGAGEEPDA
jgi:hypothetical protein